VEDIVARGVLGKEIGAGSYGAVFEGTIQTEGDRPYNYVKKETKFHNNANYCAAAAYEISINKAIEDNIQGYLSNALANSQGENWGNGQNCPQIFSVIRSELIPRYIGQVNGTDFLIEKANGNNLYKAAYNLDKAIYDECCSIDGKIGNQDAINAVVEKGRIAKVKMAQIAAQVAAAISILNENGIVSRDLKQDNIVYDSDVEITKLIDFGLSHKVTDGASYYPLIPYASASEEHKFRIENPNAPNMVSHPATDAYAFGINLTGFLFGTKGIEYVIKNFDGRLYEKKHDQLNMEVKSQFYENIDDILNQLNSERLLPLRYTKEDLEFIGKVIRWCMDSDPTKRPTTAQAAYVMEMFAAGANDFEAVKNDAIFDRPTPPGYFSKNMIDEYKKLGIFKPDSPTDTDLDDNLFNLLSSGDYVDIVIPADPPNGTSIDFGNGSDG
jgi:serine/threonine protein kinase